MEQKLEQIPSSSIDNEVEELLRTHEKETNWNGFRLVKYNGFWWLEMLLRPLVSIQKHFKAKDSDIMLSSLPKCGTTWLKALAFTIVHRDGAFPIDQSPLLTSNPHDLVPIIEVQTYGQEENPDLGHIPCPRIFQTHFPFDSLPKSILTSECRIIYICRNPLDQFVSYRTFLLGNNLATSTVVDLEESVDKFCNGIHSFGPFWDHMLGYWNAHQKYPQKVLFLKYEDLKDNITFQIKKIAEFLGVPFSSEEEKRGVIEQISNLCSFKNLSSLEANKTGEIAGAGMAFKNSSFFRKGEVGDWANYMTPTMAERIKKVMNTKFNGTGLSFNM